MPESMPLLRPISPRDPHEPGRVATALELLFDLVSVIAIAAAAAGLHHAISADHIAEGIIRFAIAFFAIWWAWMNYTWYASAYDNGDALLRLFTMTIMAGALGMAAGIGFLFEALDVTLVVLGYVLMRVGMVALWLRASLHDKDRRQTCLRYAAGIAMVQIYWLIMLLLRPASHAFYFVFIIGMAAELLVPVWAEKQQATPWHRHHMIERYGLLNIIVLGEALLAASHALHSAAGEHFHIALVHIALSALVVTFALWWLYFSDEEHLESSELPRALTWGYGHILIYASGAAVGAGFAILVDIIDEHAKVPLIVGDYAVAIPVALYLFGLWFVRDRFCFRGSARHVLPVFAVLVLLVPMTPLALEGIAATLVLCVIVRRLMAAREPSRQSQAGEH
jgi:low temperature requirement protein LtrA